MRHFVKHVSNLLSCWRLHELEVEATEVLGPRVRAQNTRKEEWCNEIALLELSLISQAEAGRAIAALIINSFPSLISIATLNPGGNLHKYENVCLLLQSHPYCCLSQCLS
jgi:hypothetical protein